GIVVRKARNGETLELLNGQTVTLRDDTLVIADHSRPVALAGIMGGEPTSVGDGTRDILLESAFFAPEAIAGRARQYGLHTDSSHRFERGVDYALQRRAIERASQLIIEITGGQPGPVVEAVETGQLPAVAEIELRAERIERVLGIAIPAAEVEAILARLGLEVTAGNGGWKVRIPSFRFDLGIEVDLIEELARVRGYERIPARRALQEAAVAPQPENRIAQRRLRALLGDRGYQEASTYNFADPKLQQLLEPQPTALPMANPIYAALSVRPTGLWPAPVPAAMYSQSRQHERVRLVELALRFRGGQDDLTQQPMTGGIATGTRLPAQWGSPETAVGFNA